MVRLPIKSEQTVGPAHIIDNLPGATGVLRAILDSAHISTGAVIMMPVNTNYPVQHPASVSEPNLLKEKAHQRAVSVLGPKRGRWR